MNQKKINSVLKEVLKKAKPSEEEINYIEISLKKFLKDLDKKIKKSRLNTEIFVGGSFAKKTMIKKQTYDVDIFLRFDKKYKNEEISKLTSKALKGIGKFSVIHGSRDYFRVRFNPYFFLEIIPVIKIKKPKEAKNITDLSYFHVNYIKRKSKIKKISDEIMLAKAFCYANNCYGAESYIQGFSGYGLELLVYHYGNFLKFIKGVSKNKEEKTIIDIEKKFKNKQEILMNINSSKLQSPIILIDPTYKQRNVLAALSEETFEKFQKACREFLKNPRMKFFEEKKIDFEKMKKDAKRRKLEFVLIETKTNKQEGDIAGSKLLKFYKNLSKEIENFFYIKNNGFEYNGEKSGLQFFAVKSKKEISKKGPNIKDKKNIKAFKKKHKKTFVKSGRIYAKEKVKFSIKEFLENWKRKNKKRMKEMSITGLRII